VRNSLRERVVWVVPVHKTVFRRRFCDRSGIQKNERLRSSARISEEAGQPRFCHLQNCWEIDNAPISFDLPFRVTKPPTTPRGPRTKRKADRWSLGDLAASLAPVEREGSRYPTNPQASEWLSDKLTRFFV
jgi:hypothetical protein